MRIYQMLIFPLHGSGSGVYVDKLSERLSDRGHHVKVLCAEHYPPHRRYPVEAILFSNGENETHDLDFNFPAFTSHPLSRQTTFGSLTERQKQAYRQTFQDRIVQELARFQPDIVHVHHGWVIASILAELDTPYVVSLHGTEHLGFNACADYRPLALKGLRGARSLVALTDTLRDQAIGTYGIDPARFAVVTTGIDARVFKPVDVDKRQALDGYGIRDVARPVVLFAGKLTGFKGVDVLLRAAHIYARSAERPLTLIAGDGNLRASLQALAQELKLDGVHFLGHQDQPRMVALYNIADVLAFPSTTDFFPLVALEALACGTPVVASDVGGFRQIVAGEVGCLVPPGDPAALAGQITAVIQGRFKEKARDAAVTHIRQNFSLERMVRDFEEIYIAALIAPLQQEKMA